MTFTLPALFLAAVLLIGCGYSVRRSPAIDRVKLGVISNNTTEPKLEDRLYETLSAALMKYGIKVDSGAPHTVRGSIDEVEIKSYAEKDDVTVQYQVLLGGSFFLDGPDGGTRALRKSGVFIVTFSSAGPLAEVAASKERALVTALSNMSEEIVDSIIRVR